MRFTPRSLVAAWVYPSSPPVLSRRSLGAVEDRQPTSHVINLDFDEFASSQGNPGGNLDRGKVPTEHGLVADGVGLDVKDPFCHVAVHRHSELLTSCLDGSFDYSRDHNIASHDVALWILCWTLEDVRVRVDITIA